MGDHYKEIQEKLDYFTNKANEHGTNVTDSTPLMKIKASIQKLRVEIKGMDLRIGVLSHNVMQNKFKDKKRKEEKGITHNEDEIE